jgi:hypothetical protein
MMQSSDPIDGMGEGPRITEGMRCGSGIPRLDADGQTQPGAANPQFQGPLHEFQSDIAACGCQRGPAWRSNVATAEDHASKGAWIGGGEHTASLNLFILK